MKLNLLVIYDMSSPITSPIARNTPIRGIAAVFESTAPTLDSLAGDFGEYVLLELKLDPPPDPPKSESTETIVNFAQYPSLNGKRSCLVRWIDSPILLKAFHCMYNLSDLGI